MEWVLWKGQVHRLESLRGIRARIQDSGSEDREVLVTELRGLPALTVVQLDRRREKLRIIDPPDWNRAQQREVTIRNTLQGDGSLTTRVEAAAKLLGVSPRTVRRLIMRCTASAQTTSLLPHPPGPKKSHRRLGPELERIIDTAIQTHYLCGCHQIMSTMS